MNNQNNTSNSLPLIFLERLESIVGSQNYPLVLESFSSDRMCSVRVNTLCTTLEDAQEHLSSVNIRTQRISWNQNALELMGLRTQEASRLEWVSQGKLYIQSLSSMLPAIVLDPQPKERVMDLCAAPGSKTTQIAALMQNQGEIVAVDSVRSRFYRLKSVLKTQGVEIAQAKCLDGARYRSADLFDKILVDAPCSSESRFKTSAPETVGYWSLRKIKEMAHKQKGLLLNACRLLKPGGTLVYSTCTFAPEENEAVVDWALRKLPGQIKLLPVEQEGISRYPSLLEWEKRIFDESVSQCFRVLPVNGMEGFFMAKLTRI